jgi:uncharacterized protein YybS (DUF2232 family)
MAAGNNAPDALLKGIVLTALLFAPAITGELDWLRTFIPAPALYTLVTSGEPRGSTILIKSVLVAGLVSMLLGTLPAFYLSVLFLPLAYVLARAVRNGQPVLRAGATGALVLAATWFFGALLYGMVEQVHPWRQALKIIDDSLAATFAMSQQSTDIAPETLAQFELAFNRIRSIIPVIFPAIVLVTILGTVWINLLLGDLLLKKRGDGLSPWPPSSEWRLPDQLVWAIIATGAGLLLPLPLLNKIGLNCMLVIGLLYFFQGMAVLTALFKRWDVPMAFRFVVYALVLIQAYGIIFLAIAGLVDVWFDLRKSQNKTT